MFTANLIQAQVMQHVGAVTLGLNELHAEDFEKAVEILIDAGDHGHPIFVAGNGASAALSQHWACDHLKGASGEVRSFNVTSLASNMALLTAIGNDVDYEHVFTNQLKHHTRSNTPGAVVLISASGKSPNVVHTARFVRDHRPDMQVISLTGFLGEPLRGLSDVNFHVALHEYEAVEDVHGAIMHTLAKLLRLDTIRRGI